MECWLIEESFLLVPEINNLERQRVFDLDVPLVCILHTVYFNTRAVDRREERLTV